MKVEYRVAFCGEKCYPQCRIKRFLWWSKWQRIAKHVEGFGLYDTKKYAMSNEKAIEIISDFDQWLKEYAAGYDRYVPVEV